MAKDRALRKVFESAVREHGRMVARIASAYESREALQQELVQDVFAALWKALPSFRGDAGLKTYIGRIAHNICVSHVRRESRFRGADLDDSLPDTETRTEEKAALLVDRDRLLSAVRDLPLSQRQVLSLHLEGFSDPEVAEALGLSHNNVAVRLTRARATLREMMGETA